MSPVDKAQEILNMSPLPADAEAQINALYEQANEAEKIEFAWIYEGLASVCYCQPQSLAVTY